MDHQIESSEQTCTSLDALEETASPENLDTRFDCNICLDTVREPVVTQCGHLFCWECIYKWLASRRGNDSFTQVYGSIITGTCPVCKTSCSTESLVPLYVRGDNVAQHDRGDGLEETRQRSGIRRRKKSFNDNSDTSNNRNNFEVPPRPRRQTSDLSTSNHSRITENIMNSEHRNQISSSIPIPRMTIAPEGSFEDEATIVFLSRLLLLLGTMVVFCLLVF